MATSIAEVQKQPRGIKGLPGFALYTLGLMLAAYMLPAGSLDPGSRNFLIALGSLAIWRYSWGGVHFARSAIYRNFVFPRLREKAEEHDLDLMPPHIYLLVTSFRIHAKTTMEVFRSTINEAIACGVPTTVVASIVEFGDELLVKDLFRMANPPEHVRLQIVRGARHARPVVVRQEKRRDRAALRERKRAAPGRGAHKRRLDQRRRGDVGQHRKRDRSNREERQKARSHPPARAPAIVISRRVAPVRALRGFSHPFQGHFSVTVTSVFGSSGRSENVCSARRPSFSTVTR